MRVFLVVLMAAFGMVIASLGVAAYTWVDFASLLLLGLGNGYIGIILFTWMQTRTPREMLGRMIGLLMFSNVGLVPVSEAISGAVSKWNLTMLFASAGALILLITVWMAFQPGLTVFSDSLSESQAEAVPASSRG